MTDEGNKQCFFISPIGDPDSLARSRSNQVLEHILRPALEPAYHVLRADRDPDPGSITSAMVTSIIGSDLIVADLTDHNPNVFYELAVAHAYRRPTIHLIWDDQRTPFDVADMRAIPYRTDNLTIAHEAKIGVERALVALLESSYPQRTPLSHAQDIVNAEQSGDPTRTMLADLVVDVQELKSVLAQMAARQPRPRATTGTLRARVSQPSEATPARLSPAGTGTPMWPRQEDRILDWMLLRDPNGKDQLLVAWVNEFTETRRETVGLRDEAPEWLRDDPTASDGG